MSETNQSRPVLILVAIGFCILGLVLVPFTGWTYYQARKQKEEDGYARAKQQADQVVEAINAEMQAEMVMAQDIADKLSSGELPYDQAVDY